MPDNSLLLLKLAEARFPDLTEPEREVVRCAAQGVEADLSQWGPHLAEGKKRKPGGGPLRSAVVVWLCTDDRAKQQVHRKGVCIAYASLDTQLDLQSADVPFFFGLHACRLPGLDAKGARFDSSLYLKHCLSVGMLDLHSSSIGGQLLCDGALVHGTDGVSILANGADIGSSVFLSEGFRAVGEVRLFGARIKGQLNCRGGHFLSRNGGALSADRADIGDNVLLSVGFRAVGEVRLLGAKIKGQLDCTGGHFLNRKGYALSADKISVGGDVLLAWGFRAMGEVRLLGADINGMFLCHDSMLINHDGLALSAYCARFSDSVILAPDEVVGEIDLRRATIVRDLILRGSALASSTLNLTEAKTGTLRDESISWPPTGRLHMDGFTYESIGSDAPRYVKERLDWLSRMPQGLFLSQPYDQLSKWYQKAGDDFSVRALRFAKEALKSKYLTRWTDRLWWWILSWTVGYGYKLQYIYVCFSVLWLSFAVFFYAGYPTGMTQSVSYQYATVSDNSTYGTANATNYPEFNALAYSLDVALPIVDLQQERYWMPNSEAKLTSWRFWESGAVLWVANWVEAIAGWLLASVLLAGATNKLSKD